MCLAESGKSGLPAPQLAWQLLQVMRSCFGGWRQARWRGRQERGQEVREALSKRGLESYLEGVEIAMPMQERRAWHARRGTELRDGRGRKPRGGRKPRDMWSDRGRLGVKLGGEGEGSESSRELEQLNLRGGDVWRDVH